MSMSFGEPSQSSQPVQPIHAHQGTAGQSSVTMPQRVYDAGIYDAEGHVDPLTIQIETGIDQDLQESLRDQWNRFYLIS